MPTKHILIFYSYYRNMVFTRFPSNRLLILVVLVVIVDHVVLNETMLYLMYLMQLMYLMYLKYLLYLLYLLYLVVIFCIHSAEMCRFVISERVLEMALMLLIYQILIAISKQD